MRLEIPCALVLLLAAAPIMGASFEGLGDFAGGSFESFASGVSADGSVAVGCGRTASGLQAFRWTAATGLVSLGSGPEGTFKQSSANAVSADGTTIVGWADLTGGGPNWATNQAFRWTQAEGMVGMPSLNGATHSEALGVSPDGSVVVGRSGQQGFRWTASGGMVDMGHLPGMNLTLPSGVSNYGSVIVGASYSTITYQSAAFRWTQSGGMQSLGYLPGDSTGCWADDISPDGSVIVGTSGDTHSFRWTQSGGMVGLGHLPGMNVTHPFAASNYGSVIVGVSYNNTTFHRDAFIWDAAGGLRNLQDVLQNEYGLNLTGWHLSSANAITPDGSVIVGEATNPSGQTEAFRAELGPDGTAPTPDPMTFAVTPYATGLYTITMTALTATDISGVEYFFQNITDANHFSGWQDSTGWTDTGLINNTAYAYTVAARDKSLARNQTDWSDPNSATTPRYLCTGPIASDLSADCQVDFLDFAMMANQWSEVLPLTVDAMTNGTFDTDIVPWQVIALPGATGYFIASFDGTTGNPVGAAIVGSDTDPDGTNGYWFYQTIPVVAGKQYKLSGEWTGDLSGYVAIDPCNRGNWAEVKVTFESSADPNTWASLPEPNFVMYRKAFGSATQNIEPSGTWDWEQITASPTNGPADGVFTATGSYMVVAFGEGGLPASGVGYYYLDNLAVRTSPCPAADFNGDCFLDMKDFAAFAEQWLVCNRTPSSECGM